MRQVNGWPVNGLTREEVASLLASPIDWRIEWCAGSDDAPAEGRGTELPEGVLERIPTRAKRRKIERGLERGTTWMFAWLDEEAAPARLQLHEGP